ALIFQKFTEPTEIQKLVIPIAIRDRLDIIGAAETGSGKTLAFGIPIVEQILADKFSNEKETILSGIRALIFAPTRELVMQIRNQIQHLLKFTLIKVESIVGGLSLQKQERLLKRNPQIIIATPGRFSALMTLAETSNYLVDWSKLQCLVIDETDRMVEKGHFIELRKILDTIRKSASEKIQTFVFSATLTYTHSNASESKAEEKINKLVEITGIRKKKCRIIDITGKRGTAERVIEARINCKNLLEKVCFVILAIFR
ncbi:unnamed protein product, partial [Thelazia callipaeda]|uniref:ATP-dependent RNA helicase n=1 Tax=Thelazia callipaeda TaxID=103827 RepID=A0A0N5CRP6_THECL